ncbi:MAG: 23S rRNA (adenine(1618)-N(6))-methyltransferase RlmF [Bacteroidota bacterium]
MHPKNPFKNDYDFAALTATEPDLKAYLKTTKANKVSLDFSQPAAVKLLNKALLKTTYQVDYWDIPKGALCPPVPGRLDYLLHMADLLEVPHQFGGGKKPKMKMLDIGTGASCIYAILANRALGWSVVATDTDGVALKTAQAILAANANLKKGIELRRQRSVEAIFHGVVAPYEQFDLCVCNPPFYASAAEAAAQTNQKWQKMRRANEYKRATRNFGGRDNELHTKGGEKAFVLQMIRESEENPKLCRWFSSLLAKKNHETPIYQALKRAKAKRIEVIPMGQGNKVSRVVAWQMG